MNPACECHGEPMLWHKEPKHSGGGRWRCRTKARESTRAAGRRWRGAHPEKARESTREAVRRWRAANPKKVRENRARWRALKFDAFVADVDNAAIFDRDGWICQLCLEPVDPELSGCHPRSASLDHVVPLSCGGTHEPANVQLAHFGCNSAKGNRVPRARTLKTQGQAKARAQRHNETAGVAAL